MSDSNLNEFTISDDWIKHRPHIKYLLRKLKDKNGYYICATYNLNQKTLNIKEDSFDMLSGIFEEFITLARKD